MMLNTVDDKKVIILVVIFGIFISGLSGWLIHQREQQSIITEFQHDVDEYAALLYREVSIDFEALQSLSILFNGEAAPEQKTFQREAAHILTRYRTIQALEWIPRVPHPERADYESEMRKTWPDFEFSQRTVQGLMIRAKQREEYYPVYYVEPVIGNKAAIGFDLASSPTRRKALERSRDLGVPQATASITLVQEEGKQKGFLAFIPVYAGDHITVERRKESLKGFVLGVYRIGDIFLHSARNKKSVELEINLIDESATAGSAPLYQYTPQNGSPAVNTVHYKKSLPELWGRQWALEASPTQHYLASKRTLLPIIISIAGLLFTLAVAVYLRIISSRAATVNKLVDEKTQQLNKAMQAKDDFLASMSHELRTPLTSILGYCDVLNDEVSDIEQRKYLKSIRSAGEGQLALVNDILDISKIQSGKFTIEKIPFSLNALIDEMQSMFSIRTQDAGIEWKIVQNNREPFKLIGDLQRIKQVLINLVGNAIKFTPQGEVTLTVAVTGTTVQFSVADTGTGIKAENIDKLFNRFEQEDSSISRRFGGSGLGLFISKKLAEMMDGSLSVESTFGSGSTFTLQLPYRVSEVEDREETATPTSGAATAEQYTGRILLAEDTPELQLLVKHTLEKMGATVEIAENGQVAIDKAAQHPFDLILMDMQMPVVDGIEATRTIRAQEIMTPIVAMTANVMQKHRDQFNAAGCNGFIGKPIDRTLLKVTLDRYLTDTDRHTTPPTIVEEIHWESAYSVGHPLMDQQHQSIIGCINRLSHCYRDLSPADAEREARKIVQEHNQYADTHLQTEEGLLDQIGYPQLRPHLEAHENYRSFLGSHYENRLDHEGLLSLTRWLQGWWKSHILKEDMAYKKYIGAASDGSDVVDNVVGNAPINPQSTASEPVDHELLEIFRESIVNHKKNLQQALKEQDWVAVKEISHQIKGSGSSFGFPVLTDKGGLVCDAYEYGQLERLPELTTDLLNELNQVTP